MRMPGWFPIRGDSLPEATIQAVLRNALVVDGLSRGLREAVKALDRGTAQLCLLAKGCTEPAYTKLVHALCKEHKVHMLEVPDSKKLGEWAGLCKYDREGQPRNVVSCTCAVVRDFGTKSKELEELLAFVEKK